MNKIFEKGMLGDIAVKNRVFMAPLTRNRAHPDGTPHEMAIKYYSQRASAGLIISEATQISPEGKGYLNTPGIYNEKHVEAWKKVTDSVHAHGGKIVLQLWHVGRISHTSLLPDRKMPLAPSAIRASAETFTEDGTEQVSEPRAMSIDEIKSTVVQYAQSAKLAIDAGFDGVEVHGANGYLLNQFISTNSNIRDDQYGGNPENRARFLLEVVDAVSGEIGSGKVGVRLSPTGMFNDINDGQAEETYSHLYREINKRNLAYLHVVERFPGYEVLNENEALLSQLRLNFSGNFIGNGNYDKLSASKVIDEGTFAVTFGRLFISNPDLPNRLEKEVKLTDPDQGTFYGGDEKGYSDYPAFVIS
jgi:N-ethylmaleimide reductase